MKTCGIVVTILSVFVCTIVLIFVILPVKNIVYADSFALTSRSTAISLDDEIVVDNDFYTINPTNCNQKVQYSFNESDFVLKDNVFTPKKEGVLKIKFSVKSGKNTFIQDELKVTVSKSGLGVKFAEDKIEIEKGKSYDLSNILTINKGKMNVSSYFNIMSIASFDISTLNLTAISEGLTTLTVELNSELKDSLEITVRPPDEINYNILITSASNFTREGNEILIEKSSSQTIMLKYSVVDKNNSSENVNQELSCEYITFTGEIQFGLSNTIAISAAGTFILKSIYPNTSLFVTVVISG